MAFFKFRWPGRGEQDDSRRPDTRRQAKSRRAPPAESADALRRRARHRLIGAAVLLVLGVVGFPILFDTQPRPIPVDIPISIPDRGQAPTLVMPAASGSAGTVASAVPVPAAGPAAAPAPAATTSASSTGAKPAPTSTAGRNANGLDEGEEIVASSSARKPVEEPPPKKEPAPKPEPAKTEQRREARHDDKPDAKPEPKPKPEPKAEVRPAAPKIDEAARARALLEGHSEPTPAAAVVAAAGAPVTAAEGRFVVQVGAFGDAEKAQEARGKLSRGGLKTYVQTVDTKDGKRHRVRVGPFASRAEADKAAGRIRGLDLPASILSL